MNGRWLWKLHQRHKFLRAEVSRDILKIQSLGNGISMAFQEVFSSTDTVLFRQNTRKTENNTVKMSQAFHTQLECFTDLNLLKNTFKVTQKWETDALQFYSMVLIFS